MIKPVGAMLLIKPEKKEDKTTASGIFISAAFDDDGLRRGDVIEIGWGEPNALNGEIIPINGFSIGDKVIFPDHTGHEIEDGDEKVIVIHHKHIIAKLS